MNEANKANQKRDRLCTYELKLEQELYISYKEGEKAVSLLQQQTEKVKRYKKIINALQSLAFAKSDKFLPSIKSPIEQCGSLFTHALLLLVNG